MDLLQDTVRRVTGHQTFARCLSLNYYDFTQSLITLSIYYATTLYKKILDAGEE